MSANIQNGISDDQLSNFIEKNRNALQGGGYLIAPHADKVELSKGQFHIQFIAGGAEYRLAGWRDDVHVDESNRITAPVDSIYNSFSEFEEAADKLIKQLLEN
jgi:hypothetical protein